MRVELYKQYVKARPNILKDKDAGELSELSQEIIAKLHSEVFSHKYHTPCKSCPKTWITYMEDLEKWYNGNKHIFEGMDIKDDPIQPNVDKRGKNILNDESKEKMRKTMAETRMSVIQQQSSGLYKAMRDAKAKKEEATSKDNIKDTV